MVSLTKIIELPPDDVEAFLAFEEHAREALENSIANADDRTDYAPFYLSYLTNVHAAAMECGIDAFDGWDLRPPINFEEFQRYEHRVLALTTRLKFRVARRIRGESIELDTSDREKIKWRVSQLRKEIEESNLSQVKKDALYAKLDELVGAFEGTRVSRGKVLVVLTAVATLLSQTQGMVLKAPETMVAIMDSISIVIGKEEERQALLERYRKPLQIEHKKPAMQHTDPREDFNADLDDEIPF